MRNTSENDTGPSDEQLLSAFWASRDEAAFAEIVRRHGPMVIQASRRIVGNTQDAEDVFQATFLALARKAGAVSRPGQLAAWLHEVATNLALNLRRAEARRTALERRSFAMSPVGANEPDTQISDLLPVVDRELAALPTKYRIPILLCDLEGRSRRAVAVELGLSDGVLSRLLDTGRRLLADRLQRQGIVVTVGAIVAFLATQAKATAAPTATLVAATAKAAVVLPDQPMPAESERAAELARSVPVESPGALERIGGAVGVGILVAITVTTAAVIALSWPGSRSVEIVYERQVPVHEFAVDSAKTSRLSFKGFRSKLDGQTQELLALNEATLATDPDGHTRVRLTGTVLPHNRPGMRVCLWVYDRSGRRVGGNIQSVPAAAAPLPADRAWAPVAVEFDLGTKVKARDIARASLTGWDGSSAHN